MIEDKFTGIEDEINSLQERDYNTNKKEMLKSILVLLPLLLSIIASIISSNFLIFMIGTSITGGQIIIGQAIKIYKDLKDVKGHKSNDNQVTVEASDFYTDEYKQYCTVKDNLDNQKYQESLDRQQSASRYNFKVYDGYRLLSKDDVMLSVTRGLEVYSKVYKLPPINVSNDEWDRLFDEMYSMYEESFKNSFYTIMLKLVKFTLASTLLDDKEEINIDTFVDNIPNVVNIKDNDLKDLRDAVVSNDNQKIIKFKNAR